MEMTWPVRKKVEGKLFISRQSWHFPFVDNTIEVLFPIVYLDFAYKQLCFPPKKKFEWKRREYYYSEIFFTLTISWLYRLWLLNHIKSHFRYFLKLSKKYKQFSLQYCQAFFPLHKDGIVKKETKNGSCFKSNTEERPRNSQSPNTSVPWINDKNITKVSEQIEGRVTKKLSQELSRTESRNLGALSKLYEFLLNPQIRTPSRKPFREHSGTPT